MATACGCLNGGIGSKCSGVIMEKDSAIDLLAKWYDHAKMNPRLYKTAGKKGDQWMPLVIETERVLGKAVEDYASRDRDTGND